jgi:hypothetical protein
MATLAVIVLVIVHGSFFQLANGQTEAGNRTVALIKKPLPVLLIHGYDQGS